MAKRELKMEEAFEWVDPVIRLVTSGGFGALLWYIFWKYIPGIEERHRNERKEWLDYIKNRDSDFDEMHKEQIRLMSDIEHKLETLELRFK